MKKRLLNLTVTVFLFILSASLSAATKDDGTIKGKITDADTGEILQFATVTVSPSKLYATSDANGEYIIKNVPDGKSKLQFLFFGMEAVDTTVTVKPGQVLTLDIALKESNFRLSDVVVTAQKSEAGKATASVISRQAMDHMQTGSLKDVMGLLPGVKIQNPNLNSAQTLSVRDNAGTAMGSLGTSVLVDGAPISNNANMQTLSSTISGSMADVNTGAGSAATGADIRTLSTDNVESIEVIRGIASVEYGDMTSGAVLVKSKAGRSPLTVRFKTNPNIYQASASKGFNISRKAGDMNISGDYAYSRSRLVRDNIFYQRASVKGLWSVSPWSSTTTNTSLTLSFGRDRERKDPNTAYRDQSFSNELGVRFNHNGHAFVNKNFLKNVNWLISGSYEDKHSHYESSTSNSNNLYSTAMTDGAVYTNIAGQHLYIYDTTTGSMTDQEITNSASTGIKGTILPYSYPYEYDIYGKEVNVFAKANADFSKTWDNLTERLMVGADFKTDGNLGKGAVYDDEYPPFRSVSNTSSGYRRRDYSDIPFINQTGLYIENGLNWKFLGREANLTAGGRLNIINDMTSFDPRVNASVDIFPWMTLRAGWGLSSKAPTSMYLYPNDAYQDMLNLNDMHVTLDESERLLIATTHVYSAENPDLEIAQNRKAEIGLDFKLGKKIKAGITYYDEYMDNGYTMKTDYQWYQHDKYSVAQTNAGSTPYVQKDTTYNLFFTMYKPSNNLVARNRGLEYEVDFGRIDAIRTSFYMNGAWTWASTMNGGYSYLSREVPGQTEYNIGVFAPGKTKSCNESLLSTFRIIHNIPQIGFVVSLTTQVSWFDKDWNEYNNDDQLIGIISRKDGLFHAFSSPMTFDEISASADPEINYLTTDLSDNRFIAEKTDPYVIFNLNLTKEIGDSITASFYVNNIFNNRPLYRSKVSGSMSELASDQKIFFGFELKVNIK
ncbi:MAG: TonB-dependent receptor [Bacteroidales bacterium]|nr:TonB-dependent receptor [Bacteroidales bacterium]